MANTYTQIYIHLVFVVSGRLNLIKKEWKDELYKFIAGIIRNDGQKLIVINGVADHLHLLIGIRPDISISNLVRDIKANSSRFINEKRFVKSKFSWQVGYGAFSYSHSQIDTIAKYIQNQEVHHEHKTFNEEYAEILENLILNMIRNICSIQLLRLSIYFTPTEFRSIVSLSYKYFTPTEFLKQFLNSNMKF